MEKAAKGLNFTATDETETGETFTSLEHMLENVKEGNKYYAGGLFFNYCLY